ASVLSRWNKPTQDSKIHFICDITSIDRQRQSQEVRTKRTANQRVGSGFGRESNDRLVQSSQASAMKTIRIANGQGFWGDSLEAPVQLVERGPIDYLTLDYLAEITMSIMQKQRARDPRFGYA